MIIILSIGEFSKVCGVSTKTLRYYDEIELLKPDVVNSENGYRYYSIEKSKQILFIQRLKSYCFSLEEIKEILIDEISEEKLYFSLKNKEKAIQEKMNTYEFIVKQMNEDIQTLERGTSIMSYIDNIKVELVETEAMNLIYLRQIISTDEYGKYIGKLYEKIVSEKLTPLGGPMTFYYSSEFNPVSSDVEFALPVKEVVEGTRILEKQLCAKSIFKGPYSGLRAVYTRLVNWLEKEEYELTNAPLEIYVNNPRQVLPEELMTEVYFPVKKK